MDDERIRQITAEVMGALRAPQAVPVDVEQRLARVEAALARIEAQRGGASAPPGTAPGPAALTEVHVHPSLQVLAVRGGSEQCVLEPDKPCVQSGACRTFGH